MNNHPPLLSISPTDFGCEIYWTGAASSVAFDLESVRRYLLQLEQPLWVVRQNGHLGVSGEGRLAIASAPDTLPLEAFTPALPPERLGNPSFCQAYGTRYAMYAGAMANGIASEEMVIALGKAGLMGSFGAGGLSPARIEDAIVKVKEALPDGPYAFNLLNSPNEPALERRTVELYLKHGVRVVEASAYLALTTNLVHYRAAGLSLSDDGQVVIRNRVIAKLSRKEVARRFFEPPAADILNQLVADGRISAQQAELAQRVPMADDITAEADSGGHTDNRPLVCLLPALRAQRDEFQRKHQFAQMVRVGAAGGIGTPAAALAAFSLGADYVVTGSVNQGCVEAGASQHTRTLLAQAEMTDVAMAPAGDMFEMGVKVQVLKRGTMFAMRAQKLYELYNRYESLEEIPDKEREKLETQVFKMSFEKVWQECERFFSERDPAQIARATQNPKDKMALVFRWYLGLSSRWSNCGEKGREMDYQIWCGPAMGAFNDWVRGTALADPTNRRVVDISRHILTGCAYLQRLRSLEMQGIRFEPSLLHYIPEE
ncbi:MAG: PfaD family polyunsaturated fatty acid/polyketide biosynthesis protein [Anaerolineae bacterium]|nr:PfaD family polyunsaturated fatty acid/polyketide biosynthesis protein [Anaerolineae bacterium]